MMSKNNIESVAEMSEFVDPSSTFCTPIKIEYLQDKVENINSKLDDLEKECEEIVASSANTALECLPIETLVESLNVEYGKSTGKFSMRDLEKRSELEKHYNKLVKEKNGAEAELKQTQFEYTLAEINKVLEHLDATK